MSQLCLHDDVNRAVAYFTAEPSHHNSAGLETIDLSANLPFVCTVFEIKLEY